MGKVLEVIQRRLGDYHDEASMAADGLVRYGRAALLRSGALVVLGRQSSHPQDTKTGWYWGLEPSGRLVISTRGSLLDWEVLLQNEKALLKELLGALRDKRILRFDSFKLIDPEA